MAKLRTPESRTSCFIPPSRCGICKHETKQKQAPVQGTQVGTQMSNIPVATPMSNIPVAAGQPVQGF